MPKTTKLTAELFDSPLEIENNSKQNFERTISGKELINQSKLDNETNDNNLFDDVYVKEVK